MKILIEDISNLDQDVMIYAVSRLINGEPKQDIEGEYEIMIDIRANDQDISIKICKQNKSS